MVSMKAAALLLFVPALAVDAPPPRALLAAGVHKRQGVATTPVKQAINLLQAMLGSAQQNRHEERVQYAAFKQFCDDVSVEKQRLCEEADRRIETLRSHVLKFDTEAERLGTEIVELKSAIEGWSSDAEAATTVRQTEVADYEALHRNYTESVVAVTHAISVLKKQAFDRPGTLPSALLQLAGGLLGRMPTPSTAKVGQAIQAFLARDSEEPDLKFVATPEVPTTAYEFRSNDIIAMLEKLEEKFKEELRQVETQEVARRHFFTSLIQDLKQSIDSGNEGITSMTRAQTVAKQNSEEASANLRDVTATRADDAAYLQGLTKTCDQKAAEFTSRQTLRDEEIQALQKAEDILLSSAVVGVAAAHLPVAALLSRRGSSLAQLRGSSGGPPTQAQLEVAELLRAASKRLGSRTLSALAVHARDDPFGKVKKLIEELLERLMTEAGQEIEHKGWCDTALATNAHTRKTKTVEIETLMGELDHLKVEIDVLTKDLSELAASVAQIEADVAKETDLRNAEKAQNAKTVQDAKDGQAAMVQVIQLLRDFYAKAGEATSFVLNDSGRRQQEVFAQPVPPPIFDKAYKGLKGESGGVLGLLEVIQSDFARLESDTVAVETAADQAYDAFMEASAIDKTQKEATSQHKEAGKQSKEASLAQKSSDLKNADRLLKTANDEYDNLKPACLDTGMTYEERRQRRRDEIEALKEALRILSDV